ncbi:MAG TPA: ATPase domain-containing protein [Methylomirabilota bacterium]|nr:ATPase domain-containing protein [Methylomirabilota bacterium]
MPARDLVKIGIDGLDEILSGGVLRGSIILVEGATGTGKTTLGMEFIYRGATEFNEPGLIVLFEISPDKLIRDAALFGWDLAELERQRRLKIVFTTRQVFQQEIQQADSLLLDEAAGIGAQRIFVDGLVRRITGGDDGHNVPEMFNLLAEGLQRERLTAMLGVEVAASDEAQLGAIVPEEFIADTIIRLRLEPRERAVHRSLEIVKARGQDYRMGRHSVAIIDGKGIEVYRRVQAPRDLTREEAAAFDPSTRISTGVPGLDELMSGGLFLGSTTLVVGITGSGKSVMALQYVAEGARRNERSLMLTLDEPPAQVLRNAASIGIDLKPPIEKGLVRLVYDRPQEIEIDRHFVQLENLVKEVRPRRAVIDSLSTYGSSLGSTGRSFRDFFHAVVALMKEHQVTTLYNHENPELLGMSSVMGPYGVSSLVDNVILLNWVELADTFRQALTIAKMRANAFDRTTHECEIVNGAGMRVLPREIPAGATRRLPFWEYYSLVARSPERHAAPSQG